MYQLLQSIELIVRHIHSWILGIYVWKKVRVRLLCFPLMMLLFDFNWHEFFFNVCGQTHLTSNNILISVFVVLWSITCCWVYLTFSCFNQCLFGYLFGHILFSMLHVHWLLCPCFQWRMTVCQPLSLALIMTLRTLNLTHMIMTLNLRIITLNPRIMTLNPRTLDPEVQCEAWWNIYFKDMFVVHLYCSSGLFTF